MKSKYLSEQNKFNNNQEEYDCIHYKFDIDNQQKSKTFEYYPIQSDKSKNEGYNIYLVTKDGNKEKNDEINKSKDNNRVNFNEQFDGIIHKDKKDDEILVSQRSIEIQIYKGKFTFLMNGIQTFKQGNLNNEFKLDKIKRRYNDSSDKDIIKNMHNIKSINNFNPINEKEFNDEKRIFELNCNNMNKNNNKYNEKNTINTYAKKININQNPYKENGIFNSHDNLNSKQLNQSSLLKYSKNYSNKKSTHDSKFFNLNDIIKHSLTKNKSLFDLFPKTKAQQISFIHMIIMIILLYILKMKIFSIGHIKLILLILMLIGNYSKLYYIDYLFKESYLWNIMNNLKKFFL